MTSLFLAAVDDLFKGPNFWFAVIWVFIGFMVFSFDMLLANRFKRCPSNSSKPAAVLNPRSRC